MQSLREAFPEFLKQIAHDDSLCLIFLAELWPKLVGEQVSRRTNPVSLRRKRLKVAVSSRSWIRQLEPLTAGMIEGINAYWQIKLIERIDLEFRPKE